MMDEPAEARTRSAEEPCRDWVSLLARHSTDLSPQLAHGDILRLRLACRALREPFGRAVRTLYVRCPVNDTPAEGPAPVPGAAFPCARDVRLCIDLLALDPDGLRLLQSTRPHGHGAAGAHLEEPPSGESILASAARSLRQVTGGARDLNGSAASAALNEAQEPVRGRPEAAGSREGLTSGTDQCSTSAAPTAAVAATDAALEGLHVVVRLPLQLQYGGSALDANRVWAMMEGVASGLRGLLPPPNASGQETDSAVQPGLSVNTHDLAGARRQHMASSFIELQAHARRTVPPSQPLLTPPFSSLTRLQLDLGGGSDDLRRLAPPPAALTAALLRLPGLRRLGLSWKRIEAAHLVAVVALTGLRCLSLADDHECADGWLPACHAVAPLVAACLNTAGELVPPPDCANSLLISPAGAATAAAAAAAATGLSNGAGGAVVGGVASLTPGQQNAVRTVEKQIVTALPPELMPPGWHPALLAAPRWLPRLRELQLRSPALALLGPPPWVGGCLNGTGPQVRGAGSEGVGEALVTWPGAAAWQPRGCSVRQPVGALGALERLDLGGARPAAPWRRNDVAPGSVLQHLAALATAAQEAAVAATAAPHAFDGGRRGGGGGSARPDAEAWERLGHGSSDSISDCDSAHVVPAAALVARCPRTHASGLQILAFEATRLSGPDWAALGCLTQLLQLRINGWQPGGATGVRLFLSVDDDDAAGERGSEDGSEVVVERGMGMHALREWQLRQWQRTAAAAAAPGSRGPEQEQGLLSLPRLQLLMAALRRPRRALPLLVGSLPALTSLHLSVRDDRPEDRMPRIVVRPPPEWQRASGASEEGEVWEGQAQEGRAREGEAQEGEAQEGEELQQSQQRQQLLLQTQGSGRQEDAGPTPGDDDAANEQMPEDWLAGWRPLMRCSQLREISVHASPASALPLGCGAAAAAAAAAGNNTGSAVSPASKHLAAALAAAWPALVSLQYSADQYDGLDDATAALLCPLPAGCQTGTGEAVGGAGGCEGGGGASASMPHNCAAATSAQTAEVAAVAASRPSEAAAAGGGGWSSPKPATAPGGGSGAGAWSQLQVLSLGAIARSLTGTAPLPLHLSELPPRLRALSLLGLELRWSRAQGADAGVGGGSAPAGGGGLADTGAVLPASLQLLSLKFCSWRVPHVSLWRAAAGCTGLLELRLAWTSDGPPGGGGGGGSDLTSWPGQVPSAAAGGAPHTYGPGEGGEGGAALHWCQLAAALPGLEKLDLLCWELASGGGGSRDEAAGDGAAGGKATDTAEDADASDADELAGDGRSRRRSSHTGTTGGGGPDASAATGLAAALAGWGASPHAGRLRSLRLAATVSRGWGADVCWRAGLAPLTGLVSLALHGLSPAAASRVAAETRQMLPGCRSLLLAVDNIEELYAQLHRTDALLEGLVGEAAAAVAAAGPQAAAVPAALAAAGAGAGVGVGVVAAAEAAAEGRGPHADAAGAGLEDVGGDDAGDGHGDGDGQEGVAMEEEELDEGLLAELEQLELEVAAEEEAALAGALMHD